ncbi:MAG: M20/M25/M40 family metallo-hydrolase [Myxococcales bacterium]|nr:M20/M25/M40 family metallo-hydrolase [Myxococcales bacterium]
MSSPPIADAALADHAFDLLVRLLRIPSVNPPGDERDAADLVAQELREAGLEPQMLVSSEKRANVVARLKGTGELPPLVLTGHLDVVPVEPDRWTHPPFDGVVGDDGCLYGRGAVDMKNHVAMSLAVITRLAREKVRPRRDLIFAAVADEEQGCRAGSLWLCREHRDLVHGEYALGEGGGFSLHLGGKTFYPVQVAEKGVCWLKATVDGPPGHGSMPRADSALLRLAEKVARLHPTALPVHRTPIVEAFLGAVVDALAPQVPGLRELAAGLAAQPAMLRALVDRIPDPTVKLGLLAMFSNTASPTVFRAGDSVNVIPGRASCEIDGRLLPGQSETDFLRELRDVLGDDVTLEVDHTMPAVEATPWKTPLYATIEQVMADRAPGCPVVPYMLPGFTDAKGFAQIGTTWVGFAPVKLPKGLRFADLFHAHDERIPVEGFRWGTEVLADIVTRWIG